VRAASAWRLRHRRSCCGRAQDCGRPPPIDRDGTHLESDRRLDEAGQRSPSHRGCRPRCGANRIGWRTRSRPAGARQRRSSRTFDELSGHGSVASPACGSRSQERKGCSAARGRRRVEPSPARLLSMVPGISPRLALELLGRFGSVAAVAAATSDELLEIRGVGPARAAALRRALLDTFLQGKCLSPAARSAFEIGLTGGICVAGSDRAEPRHLRGSP
jgi:Helix-hairpin-helix domain